MGENYRNNLPQSPAFLTSTAPSPESEPGDDLVAGRELSFLNPDVFDDDDNLYLSSGFLDQMTNCDVPLQDICECS